MLKNILEHKQKENEQRKELYPLKLLEQSIYFETPVVSLKEYILRKDKSGIIAEFKRRSPSKGVINAYASIEQVTIGYMMAGASALSVLTDTEFFGGRNEDLGLARKFNFCPILRKDFIIDPYQVYEAKSIGADAILLIAAAMDEQKSFELAKLAKELGMEVLMEIHTGDELAHLNEFVELVGVNNRDLHTFQTDYRRSLQMADQIPANVVKISESGLEQVDTILELKEAGYQGFLIGEYFMKNSRPEKACRKFIDSLKKQRL